MSLDPIAGSAAAASQVSSLASPPADGGEFEAALRAAGSETPEADSFSLNPAFKGMFGALEHVNGEAAQLSASAATVRSHGAGATPGEMIELTMRANEFMFHCELTSNIANRSSDGLQQLFRQQG